MEDENYYDTLTFVNTYGLTTDEIAREFGAVGEVPKVRQLENRVFIGFLRPNMAETSLRISGSKYKAEMIENRPRGRPAVPPRAQGMGPDEFLQRFQRSASPVAGPSSESSDPRNGLYDDYPRYSVVISNLPSRFKESDLQYLLSDVRPKIIHRVTRTRACEINFCHILVHSEGTLNYVIKKLGGLTLYDAEIVVVPTNVLVNMRLIMG